VLGSTSAYDSGIAHDYPPPWIDETAPLDLDKPRVKGEEFLRTQCGAIVLRVAGIYGPGRHPYQWIKSGRVGLSDKYVNLIHVEDLAAICLAALEHGVSGAIYNVSDGMPRTWREIGRGLDGGQLVEPQPAEQKQALGKRINTTKLRAMLQEARISMRHPDLFRALEDLQQASAGTQTERTDQ
jgi:nucleoside-diphosphate-sugar epimerase